VREGGGRDLQLLLQASNRKSGATGADQRAVDFQPGRVTQRFQMSSGVIDFHEGIILSQSRNVNHISRIMEIRMVIRPKGSFD
jgi:hypothetical protein